MGDHDDHDRLLRALLVERYTPWPPQHLFEADDRLRRQLRRERRRTTHRHPRSGQTAATTTRREDQR